MLIIIIIIYFYCCPTLTHAGKALVITWPFIIIIYYFTPQNRMEACVCVCVESINWSISQPIVNPWVCFFGLFVVLIHLESRWYRKMMLNRAKPTIVEKAPT